DEKINSSMARVTIPSRSDVEVKVSTSPNKDMKREAAFNLDYLPPRTHPPAHN
ncbi:hypothetical protein HAX54_030858, partial [Datura stramonium]|nr:hypothetical protein [Datura stramonium]